MSWEIRERVALGVAGKAFGPPLRVAVLSGGESAEREISLQSGAAVCAALDEAGHEVIAIDPAGRSLAEIDWSTVDACFLALHGGAGEDGHVQHELDALGVAYTGSGPDACRLAMSKSAAKQQFAASAERLGGTPNHRLAKPGLGRVALVEGRIHDDQVVAPLHLLAGEIKPMIAGLKGRAETVDILARRLQSRVIRLVQIDAFDLG